MEMTLAAWTKSEDFWQTKADVFQAAKEALDAAGIEIPFPHRVVVSRGGAGGSDSGAPAGTGAAPAEAPAEE